MDVYVVELEGGCSGCEELFGMEGEGFGVEGVEVEGDGVGDCLWLDEGVVV